MNRFYSLWDSIVEFMEYLIEFILKAFVLAAAICGFVILAIVTSALAISFGGSVGWWTSPF